MSLIIGKIIGKVMTPLGVGLVAGIYIDQNYTIPPIKGYIDKMTEFVKKTEEEFRKNNNDNSKK